MMLRLFLHNMFQKNHYNYQLPMGLPVFLFVHRVDMC